MTVKEELIKAQQLLTYEEWYELNKVVFTTTKTHHNPEELYNEYVEEIIKNFPKPLDKINKM
jgi:hypothetical protein